MVVASLVLPIVLFIVMLIFPIFELVGLITGLDFVIANEMVWAIVLASLSFAVMMAILIMRTEYGITGKIFWNLLPPMALLNAIAFADGEWGFSIICAVIWSLCCFVTYLRAIPDSGFKATSAVFSVLFAIIWVVLYLYNAVFNPIVDSFEVRDQLTSPDGEIMVEVQLVKGIIEDSTRIQAKKINPEKKSFMGSYVVDDLTIYEGAEYETDTVKLNWANDNTLIINDVEYPISWGE